MASEPRGVETVRPECPNQGRRIETTGLVLSELRALYVVVRTTKDGGIRATLWDVPGEALEAQVADYSEQRIGSVLDYQESGDVAAA